LRASASALALPFLVELKAKMAGEEEIGLDTVTSAEKL
jgi:hypothetical protein